MWMQVEADNNRIFSKCTKLAMLALKVNVAESNKKNQGKKVTFSGDKSGDLWGYELTWHVQVEGNLTWLLLVHQLI